MAALILALAALALALVAPPIAAPTAHADGGAPNLAYVVGGGTSAGDLTIIDIGQRRVTGHVALGGDPRAVILSPDARTVYVAQAARNTVAVVDAHAQTVTTTLPAGRDPVALALDIGATTNLYIADQGANAVTVLDTDHQRVIAVIPVGAAPAGLAIAGPASGISDPTDAEVYVANSGDNTVSVISAAQRKVIATIPAPGGPLGVVIPASGGIAYVSTRAGTILALGLANHQLLGTVLNQPGGVYGNMDYDAITNQIYVPDATTNVVDILRPASAGPSGLSGPLPNEPARILPVTGGPAAIAITFDGAYGFVAQRQSGQVTMFDAGSRQTLATLSVGGAPAALITGSYPPLLSPQAANLVGLALYALIGAALLAVAAFYLGWFRRKRRPALAATSVPGMAPGEASDPRDAGAPSPPGEQSDP